MNSLIILEQECVDPTLAVLQGSRALYAFETHGVRVGQTIRIAVLGLNRGEGVVETASSSEVQIRFTFGAPALENFPAVHLIVGVPRPQTIKKVVQAAVMLGARSLHFVRSEKGDKSYLQSRSLEPGLLLEESIKALEQVWDAHPPQIKVDRSFETFCKEDLCALTSNDSNSSKLLFVAHPSGNEFTYQERDKVKKSESIVIAVGPERGWSDGEVGAFVGCGFNVLGLGPRVMRVEIALVFLMGQLRILSQ